MATLREWINGETSNGGSLPPAKVAAYRQRHPEMQPTLPATQPQRISRQHPQCPIRRGVGTHLKLLLKEFGVNADLCGEGCGSFAAMMDGWGIDGCRQNRDKIKERLLQKYKETTWMTSVNAAFRSVWSGNVFKMDVLHPVDWLIDEAIRRAEEEELGSCEPSPYRD